MSRKGSLSNMRAASAALRQNSVPPSKGGLPTSGPWHSGNPTPVADPKGSRAARRAAAKQGITETPPASYVTPARGKAALVPAKGVKKAGRKKTRKR